MSSSKSTTVRLQRYYKVTKASPKPLSPEDIHVDINQASHMPSHVSDQPNSFALALLWSYYQACQQGSLDEALPSPWEIITLDAPDEETLWIRFLKEMITDKTWVDWIQDPKEVKRRALTAFQHLTNGGSEEEPNLE